MNRSEAINAIIKGEPVGHKYLKGDYIAKHNFNDNESFSLYKDKVFMDVIYLDEILWDDNSYYIFDVLDKKYNTWSKKEALFQLNNGVKITHNGLNSSKYEHIYKCWTGDFYISWIDRDNSKKDCKLNELPYNTGWYEFID